MARQSKRSKVTSLHDEAYADFVSLLIERRKASGLSQQAVADALGWQQSVIAKIETAQRRIDVIELVRLSKVVGFDASKLVREIRTAMTNADDIED